MLEYSKGAEPRSLTKYRTTTGADWGSVGQADKQKLREAVCRDQGALCVYCERRIRAEEGSAFIEHWKSRSTGEDIFRWRNLLGVCSGKSAGEIHCDRSRPANTDLHLQPISGLGPSPRKSLKYLASGRLESQDSAPAEVKRDIEDYLNLNAPPLQRARRVVYDQLRFQLEAEGFGIGALRRELRRVTSTLGNKLPEQAELVRYQVERWLRKKQKAGQ